MQCVAERTAALKDPRTAYDHRCAPNDSSIHSPRYLLAIEIPTTNEVQAFGALAGVAQMTLMDGRKTLHQT